MAAQPTELYDFSTDTGLTIPDTADLRSAIVSRIVSVFGPNVDTSEETHVGRFIDELTEIVVQTTGINAQNANQFNLNYATGTFLDNLGAAFGLPRVTASRTLVDVRLTCSQTTTIPSGTIFSTTDGYDFKLNEDVTVTATGTAPYVGYGTASAVDYGKIYCPAFTLTKIKTAVLGLIGVMNTTAGEPGRDLETDAHFRNRIKTAREGGAASCGAILNALYSLRNDQTGDPVVACAVVLENGHAYPVLQRGIVLAPHSIYVCVTGDDGSSASVQKITRAIYESKTAGADYTRETVFSELQQRLYDRYVTDAVSGVSSRVSFFRPVRRGLRFAISLSTKNYTGTNAHDAVISAVQDYLSSEGIGASITGESVVTAIATSVASSIIVTDLKLYYDGTEVEGVTLSAGEEFTTSVDSTSSVRLEFDWV